MTTARHTQKGSTLLIASLLLITIAAAIAAYGYINWPAKNATMAMARGQYRAASEYYAADASKGDFHALNSLANLYYIGLGVGTDYEKAAALYFEAAKNGDAAAQLNLGHLYSQGLGVGQNPMRSFGWYNMSHNHGSPWAEYYMNQLALEFTLSPNQVATALKKWNKLSLLVAEGL